jgi:hypothetical protein
MSNRVCGPDIIKYFVVEPATSTTTGFSVCNGFLYVNNITGCTDNVNLNTNTFYGNGEVLFTSSVTACTGIYTSNLFGCSPINLHDDIIPINDDLINLGVPIKRFRDVNTVSGTSTVWQSTIKITTPEIDLGLDTLGNQRIITADNSILQNDILIGGAY